ncbi:YifB family Mg chelatase-like AAA ATPase [Serratia microhaemolytica]|uniref:YifB family Mg chelatase-like AAA ATPase n=1 Tax=Serratia microhaemolytica TaxID=2675110 RepID=UPI000FDF18E5|nr:YifB family Mg chelatase-like AAA ATPase [Serratia microhaemolytica]
MSLAVIYTRALIGVQAPSVMVEVHISNGLPGLTLVGLPEATVKEARDRVRSALINNGFTFPAKRITVNLAPADLPKEGGRYDLPIAIAILAASEQLPAEQLVKYEFLGELALSGAVRAVYGAIPAAIAAHQAERQLILPAANGQEAGLLPNSSARTAEHLLDVCHFLQGQGELPQAVMPPATDHNTDSGDLQDVIGQQQAKRALEIAAAGGHNLLLLGPPGTGKTMLASRLNSLLPPLSDAEALESVAVASLLHHPDETLPWRQRPFRAPHHSASMAALVGGGSLPRPGEISLAHNGVLFLDELPEFERRVLDALREPLESGEIIISRASAKVRFPARVQLIAAMNPSPTGHYQGVHNRTPPQQILRYLSRLSGPFLDRFDLSIEVPLLPLGMLSQQTSNGESSQQVRQRVLLARDRQLSRAGKLNAVLNKREVDRDCHLPSDQAEFLEKTLNKLGLSVRAWHRILKVARTLADLNGEATIDKQHLSEALGYRSMDRLLLQLHRNLQ